MRARPMRKVTLLLIALVIVLSALPAQAQLPDKTTTDEICLGWDQTDCTGLVIVPDIPMCPIEWCISHKFWWIKCHCQ